jgi:large subunit ribosomal protein L6
MSRIGKTPVALPSGVKVSVKDGTLTVAGPKGTLEGRLPSEIRLKVGDGGKTAVLERSGDDKKSRELHGTWRRLLENMVVGTVTPYERELEIVGVGFQAKMQANAKTKKPEIRLTVGFANPVDLEIPAGLKVECVSPTMVKVTGSDKCLVGQFAANIRAVRPPEPYNGKGIKYRGERIQRKQGKSFVSSS